jgi:signal transduction histidine kinase
LKETPVRIAQKLRMGMFGPAGLSALVLGVCIIWMPVGIFGSSHDGIPHKLNQNTKTVVERAQSLLLWQSPQLFLAELNSVTTALAAPSSVPSETLATLRSMGLQDLVLADQQTDAANALAGYARLLISEATRASSPEDALALGLSLLTLADAARFGTAPHAIKAHLADVSLRDFANASLMTPDRSFLVGREAHAQLTDIADARAQLFTARQALVQDLIIALRADGRNGSGLGATRLEQPGLSTNALLGLAVTLGLVLLAVSLHALLFERKLARRLTALGQRAHGALGTIPERANPNYDELEAANAVFDRLGEFHQVCKDLEINLSAAKQDAEDTARAKTEFLAMMSHEVRTPLNAIIGMFELIARSDIPERQRKRARNGRLAAEQLFSLLSKILDASRLEANGMDVHLDAVSVQELIQNARETTAAALVKYESAVTLHTESNVPAGRHIRTDGVFVRQILTNLIDNAVRFTPQGQIELRFVEDESQQMLHIEVNDTGIGIDAENERLIFEPFRQVDSGMRRKQGGSGLGLSISRGLATLLKGELSYKARASGGSSFILRLPFDAVSGESRNEDLVGRR